MLSEIPESAIKLGQVNATQSNKASGCIHCTIKRVQVFALICLTVALCIKKTGSVHKKTEPQGA